jgi:hypothetical protein
MRASCLLAAALFTLSVTPGFGQEKVFTPDLSKIKDRASWTIYNATAEAVQADGKKAVRLKSKGDSAEGIIGLALPAGVDFTTGTIEVELKGKNVRQESFVGVSFNVVDDKTFEAVYFRPFNFKAQGEFKGRAVQYISWPAHTWEKLRESQPGKFEAPINPVPEPDGWFRARIEVGEKQVRVFVNGAQKPCLTVNRLTASGKSRRAGLFVDVSDGLYANLKIRPAK